MRLWGKVARGMLLVFAVFFTVLAVVAPEMRREAIAAVVLSIAVGLLGVPAIVRLFSSFTGAEEVLANRHHHIAAPDRMALQPLRSRCQIRPQRGSGRCVPGRDQTGGRSTTKEGRTLEGRSDVQLGTWGKLKEGDSIVVEYLQDAPDTNRVPDQLARSSIWGIMALVLLVVSAVLFVMGWRKRPVDGVGAA